MAVRDQEVVLRSNIAVELIRVSGRSAVDEPGALVRALDVITKAIFPDEESQPAEA